MQIQSYKVIIWNDIGKIFPRMENSIFFSQSHLYRKLFQFYWNHLKRNIKWSSFSFIVYMRLVSKYEDFMAPFLILPQQGEMYMNKIRPVLDQRSLPSQHTYFFLNNQEGQLSGSSMSNFGNAETAAGFMKHSLATCRKNYAEASSKGELYFPSICSHFTLFEIILWN